MKIAYQKPKLSRANFKRLEQVNDIVEQYAKEGYTLTLRQLYYQLVSKNIIANVTKEYDRLSHLLTQGRLGGIVDWDAIEDRIRTPNLPYYNHSVEQAVEAAHDHFRLDRMDGQDNYIELWVEKDAISSIMKRRTHHYGIRLMVNRGYSSTTAMHDAFKRFEAAIEIGQHATILYLGDADPSGLDMALNDIPKRLEETFGTSVDVQPIAITWPQIKQYDPPPNPAKIKDPRAAWFIKTYGESSYEVDSLEPKVLAEIVTREIESRLDMDMFEERLKEEERQKKVLAQLPEERNKLAALSNLIKKEARLKTPSTSKKLLKALEQML